MSQTVPNIETATPVSMSNSSPAREKATEHSIYPHSNPQTTSVPPNQQQGPIYPHYIETAPRYISGERPYIRQDGLVTVKLHKRDTANPALPVELNGLINESEWHRRLDELRAILNRFAWPQWRFLILLLAFLGPLVVPWPLINLVTRQMRSDSDFDDQVADTDDDGYYWIHSPSPGRAAASLGIFVGVFIIFWTPYILSSMTLNRKLKAFFANVNSQETFQGGNAKATHWSSRRMDFVGSSTELYIQMPSMFTQQASVYDPRAYLPPYCLIPLLLKFTLTTVVAGGATGFQYDQFKSSEREKKGDDVLYPPGPFQGEEDAKSLDAKDIKRRSGVPYKVEVEVHSDRESGKNV